MEWYANEVLWFVDGRSATAASVFNRSGLGRASRSGRASGCAQLDTVRFDARRDLAVHLRAAAIVQPLDLCCHALAVGRHRCIAIDHGGHSITDFCKGKAQ